MSEPTRYDFDEYGGCYELSEGDYVLYSDYARLKAEVDALITNPTSRLLRAKQAENAVLAIENDSLKAEVERLRKAGDDMAHWLMHQDRGKSYAFHVLHDAICAWHAAKEGKPSV